MGRAQHMKPQRAFLGLVVDELPLPGEQSLVFQTLDRLARTKTHIAGKNVHQFVLRVFCKVGWVLAGFWIEATYPHRHSGMRLLAQASDAQLRIGESILTIAVMDSGLSLRSPR